MYPIGIKVNCIPYYKFKETFVFLVNEFMREYTSTFQFNMTENGTWIEKVTCNSEYYFDCRSASGHWLLIIADQNVLYVAQYIISRGSRNTIIIAIVAVIIIISPRCRHVFIDLENTRPPALSLKTRARSGGITTCDSQ